MGRLADFRTSVAQILAPKQFRETVQQYPKIVESLRESESMLVESLSLLQLEMEDAEWIRISGEHDTQFTRPMITRIIKAARVMFLKNPTIKRQVEIQGMYVFGKGVQITSDDDAVAEVIQDFTAANAAHLGIPGLVAKDQSLRTDGNLFFAMFTGDQKGDVKVRMIDPLEIEEIFCNPNDKDEPWFYKRQWNLKTISMDSGAPNIQTVTKWYPALGYKPKTVPAKIGSDEILWKTPLLHVKAGSLEGWSFGIPEVYASMSWARAYKEFLDAWHKITMSLARFAWSIKTPGGAKAIDAIATRMQTTLGPTSRETNPPPQTGSAFVGGPNQDISAIKTAGSTTDPEQGRRIFLMAIDGLPETMFGDVNTGNLATAKSLDRPTELKFLVRQEKWKEILRTLYGYAISQSLAAPGGALKEAATDDTESPVFVVDFPDILEHDIRESIGALVDAATLQGKSFAGVFDPRTFVGLVCRELGFKELADSLPKLLYPDKSDGGGYDPTDFAAQPRDVGIQPGTGIPPLGSPTAGAADGAVAEAIRELRQAFTEAHEILTRAA